MLENDFLWNSSIPYLLMPWWCMEHGGHLNIMIPSHMYQYRDTHQDCLICMMGLLYMERLSLYWDGTQVICSSHVHSMIASFHLSGVVDFNLPLQTNVVWSSPPTTTPKKKITSNVSSKYTYTCVMIWVIIGLSKDLTPVWDKFESICKNWKRMRKCLHILWYWHQNKKLCQYHCCWCPGFSRCQGISSNDINYTAWLAPCFPRRFQLPVPSSCDYSVEKL